MGVHIAFYVLSFMLLGELGEWPRIVHILDPVNGSQ